MSNVQIDPASTLQRELSAMQELLAKGDYEEDKHPRGDDGKWVAKDEEPLEDNPPPKGKAMPFSAITTQAHKLYYYVDDYHAVDALNLGIEDTSPSQGEMMERMYGYDIYGVQLRGYDDAAHLASEESSEFKTPHEVLEVNIPKGTRLYLDPTDPSALLFHGRIPPWNVSRVKKEDADRSVDVSKIVDANPLAYEDASVPRPVERHNVGWWAARNGVPKSQFTEAEWYRIDNYTDKGYKSINSYLRTRGRIGEDAVANDDTIDMAAQVIDGAIRKSKLKDATIVYRGVKEGFPFPTEVGTRFRDDGFVSTTLTDEIARLFHGKAEQFGTLQIELPQGMTALYVPSITGSAHLDNNAGELEVLLPRGLEFEVKSIEVKKTGDKDIYFVEHPSVDVTTGSRVERIKGPRTHTIVTLVPLMPVRKADYDDVVYIPGSEVDSRFAWSSGDIVLVQVGAPLEKKHLPNQHDQETHGNWQQTVINDFKFVHRASKYIPLFKTLNPKTAMGKLLNGGLHVGDEIFSGSPTIKVLRAVGAQFESDGITIADTRGNKEMCDAFDAYRDFLGGDDDNKGVSDLSKMVKAWMDGKANKGLDLMWAATQAYLAKTKTKAIVLHRGMSLPKKLVARLDSGEIQAADVDTVGHWSESFGVSDGFASENSGLPVVFLMNVPARHILFHYQLAGGSYYHEKEIVPLMSAHPKIRSVRKGGKPVTEITAEDKQKAKEEKKKAQTAAKVQLKIKYEAAKLKHEKKKAKAKVVAQKKFGKKYSEAYFEKHYYDYEYTSAKYAYKYPDAKHGGHNAYDEDEYDEATRLIDLEFRKK